MVAALAADDALFAYLIPQLLFRRTSGHWMNAFLPFYPVAALVSGRLCCARFPALAARHRQRRKPERDEPATPAENIDALITAGTEEGLIQEDDRKLIQSVVAFGDKVVREVMTPRPNIVAIQADETLAAAARTRRQRTVFADSGLPRPRSTTSSASSMFATCSKLPKATG